MPNYGDPTADIFEPRFASPEQNFLAAIVFTAAEDLDSGDEHVRWEAFEFFLQDKGPWEESRRELFDALGLSDDAVREGLADKLANPPERPALRLHQYNEECVFERLPKDKIFTAQDVADMFSITRQVALDRLKALAKSGRIYKLSPSQYALTGATYDVRKVLRPTPAEQAVKNILNALFKRPLTIREINFALEGSISTSRIREILYQYEEKGVVVRDVTEWSLADPKSIAA